MNRLMCAVVLPLLVLAASRAGAPDYVGIRWVPGSNWKVASTVNGLLAEKVGLQAGDVVEEVNGKRLRTITDWEDAVIGTKGFTLRIQRNGMPKTIEAKAYWPPRGRAAATSRSPMLRGMSEPAAQRPPILLRKAVK